MLEAIVPQKYTVHHLLKAIREVKDENKPVMRVGRMYNIPKTSLFRYLGKINQRFPDFSKVSDEQLLEFIASITLHSANKAIFSAFQERALVECLLECSQFYFGLSRGELRRMALEFAKQINVAYPENWRENQMASRDWYEGFMRRHENLSVQRPEQITANRATIFRNQDVYSFFSELIASYHGKKMQPNSIWNMDQSVFPSVPSESGELIAEKELKQEETNCGDVYILGI